MKLKLLHLHVYHNGFYNTYAINYLLKYYSKFEFYLGPYFVNEHRIIKLKKL